MLKGLTDADVRLLKRAIQQTLTELEGEGQSSLDEVPNPASAIYVAALPSGTISARSGTTLGSATCTFYTINDSGGLVSLGFTRTVYNVSDSALEADYAIVRKSKSGRWLVDCPCSASTGTGT